MDETATKNVVEAALLAAGGPLSFDKLVDIFSRKGVDVDRATVRGALAALGADYEDRAIELKETASGFRIQVRSSARDWLEPLFEERAPRYTRALLETLALVAYRQPITRAEIEEVRGVAVSTNIIRTLLERGWVRVVGYRDVPGKPSMLGTTKEFLDYFGLRKLDDLPPLSEIRELMLEANPQSDFVEALYDVSAEGDGGVAAAEVGTDVQGELPSADAAADEGTDELVEEDAGTDDEPDQHVSGEMAADEDPQTQLAGDAAAGQETDEPPSADLSEADDRSDDPGTESALEDDDEMLETRSARPSAPVVGEPAGSASDPDGEDEDSSPGAGRENVVPLTHSETH